MSTDSLRVYIHEDITKDMYTMNLTKSQEQINELYEFARARGFSDKMLLTSENLDRFVETAIDGYEGYPLSN